MSCSLIIIIVIQNNKAFVEAIDPTMALVLFKVLYIFSLLFISGQALFFENPFFRFPDPFSKFRNGPKDNDNERSSGFFRKNASTGKYNGEWELVLEKIITVS